MSTTTYKKFQTAFANYKRSVKETMDYALEASTLALLHFQECGDVTPLRQFYDATPKNYGRKEAVKVWAMAHSPLLVSGKGDEEIWAKDKSEDAREFDLLGATKKPFWEFAPERPIVNFYPTTIITALEKSVKKFDGEKQKPGTDNAVKALAMAKAAIAELAVKLNELNTIVQEAENDEGVSSTDFTNPGELQANAA